MRTCTVCKETKPLAEFWKDKSKKHGYSARCKACKAAIYNVYRKERGYDAKRYAANVEGERERHLIRKYGVTLVRYREMFDEQGGRCAICGKRQDKALDVDHDHVTGAVRGLLCTNCNRMIGHAADDSERLRKAAAYLDTCRP